MYLTAELHLRIESFKLLLLEEEAVAHSCRPKRQRDNVPMIKIIMLYRDRGYPFFNIVA